MNHSKVYIVIVNWNGWSDTIECLESVFRLVYENYTVIVCDNGSSDGSLQHIKAWAEGNLDSWVTKDNPLNSLSHPPVSKPIPFLSHESASENDCKGNDAPLILIKNALNLGFAGANNVALRFILKTAHFDYVWLLNNDTVVHPDALTFLVERMMESSEAGMCGSTLFFYDHNELVQSQGGAVYNKWLGIARPIGANKLKEGMLSTAEVEKQINYVAGASMLVSRNFLLNIGLLSEDYFLYYEEIDWAVRGERFFNLVYAEKSVVYHKEGASIGSSVISKNRSILSEYFMIRNRFLFTTKFFPYFLPFVFAGFIITLLNRIRRREWNKILPVLVAPLHFIEKFELYTPKKIGSSSSRVGRNGH